jgi:hypothetical protein
MKKSIKNVGSVTIIATLLGLQACGGGGGDSPAPAPAPTLAPGVFNDAMALKLALVMLGDSAVSINETRTRGDYRDAWDNPTASTTLPCPGRLGSQSYTFAYTNADATPSVGDLYTYVDNCNYRHLSTNGLLLNQQTKNDITLSTVTDPLFSGARAWTVVEAWNGTNKYSYESILVSGSFTYSATSVNKSRTGEYTVSHAADDTEIQSSSFKSTLIDETPIGNSNLVLSTRYNCRYMIGLRSDPDCSDTSAEAIGSVMGVAVNASLIGISMPKWGFDITDGSNKISVRLNAFGKSQLSDKFAITLPSGRVVEVTGEDLNWISGG